MTSNDIPLGPGATAGRRRVLGRGAPRAEAGTEAELLPEEPRIPAAETEAALTEAGSGEAPVAEIQSAGAEVTGAEAALAGVAEAGSGEAGVANAEAALVEAAEVGSGEAGVAEIQSERAAVAGAEVALAGVAKVGLAEADAVGAAVAEAEPAGAEPAWAEGVKAEAAGAGAALVEAAEVGSGEAGVAKAESAEAELTGAESAWAGVVKVEAAGAGAALVEAAEVGVAKVGLAEVDAVGAAVAEAEPAGAEPASAGVVKAEAAEAAEAGVAEVVPAGAEGGAVLPEGGESDGVFKVRLANFEGPFDLLLQLISKHKLDVTEVALSKVTDEFMAYIRAMGPDWDLDETTEFLVVAATLLDLKAARLLPAAQVEDEADLALLEARDLLFARLLQYRAYKQVADIFNRRLDEEARRCPRTVGLEPHHADLLPEVVISIGPEGFAKLAVKAMQPKPKPQVYVDHIHAPLVSVQEQAGIVVARLRELGEASFRLLVEDADGTLTVVARFLALLELYREKAVALDQETALGELVVRWTGGEGEVEPTVTDEFDRPPEPPKEDKA